MAVLRHAPWTAPQEPRCIVLGPRFGGGFAALVLINRNEICGEAFDVHGTACQLLEAWGQVFGIPARPCRIVAIGGCKGAMMRLAGLA
jgi:hypothetical protein